MTLKQLGAVCLIAGASLCALLSAALAGPRTDNRHPVGWERMHRPVRAQRAQLDPYGTVQIPKDIQSYFDGGAAPDDQVDNPEGDGHAPQILPNNGPRPQRSELVGSNVRVNNTAGDPAGICNSETHMAALGNYMVAGWNDGLNFGTPPGNSGYSYSVDGGLSWIDGGVPPNTGYPTGRYEGDPVLAVDNAGNFYYANLFTPDGSQSGLSVNHGKFAGFVFTWDPPVVPVQTATDFLDKEWIAVDPVNGNIYMSYTRFLGAGGDQVEFTYSTNQGATWSVPQVLTNPALIGIQGSRPVVDAAHGVHVIYYAEDNFTFVDGQRMRSSSDMGVTFGAEAVVAAPIYTNYGSGPPGYNRTNCNGFASVAVDRSGGPRNGNLYATWAEAVDFYDDNLGGNGVVNEVENNGTPATANPFTLGNNLLGSLASTADQDWFKFNAVAGQTVEFYMAPNGSAEEGFLRLFAFGGATAQRVAVSHFSGGQAVIVYTIPTSGTYFLRALNFDGVATHVGAYVVYTGLHLPVVADVARDCRDVMLTSSSDGGATWTPRTVVNDDAALFDNSFPEVAVDGIGKVHVDWYDHRNDPGSGILTDMYYSRSQDGGATFPASVRINDGPSLNWSNVSSNLQPNMGDYSALVADGMNVYGNFADGRQGSPDSWFVPISGGFTVQCPTAVGARCPGDTVSYTYHVCSNDPFPAYLIFSYTNSAGSDCARTDSALINPGECRDISFSCVIPRCTKNNEIVFDAAYSLSNCRDQVVRCSLTQPVNHNQLYTFGNCAQGRIAQPGESVALNWNFCVQGVLVCPDSLFCDLFDSQGWLFSGPQHQEGPLALGCVGAGGQIDVPANCAPGDSTIVYFICHNTCGDIVDTCATVIKCQPITPVRMTNIDIEAGHRFIEVKWTAFIEGASSFRVSRSATRAGSYAQIGSDIDGGRGSDFSLRDESVRPATEYWYKVGYNTSGNWTWSQPIRVKTPAAVFSFSAARPNPTRGATRLDYEIERTGTARLEIYNLNGQRIRTLLDGPAEAGTGSVTWDGRTASGDRAPAGAYFARLSSAGKVANQRIMLLR